ncbi:lytic transglycosylase domain-containing protein [Tenacibaculum sp. SG-28]|uniref:lytic transglycosylase domain-containing protein n=1 Tax=Tenacibaculum sp. SG-28 TaxID=754426 RepID=UPI000CF4974F|nr:lytic transglycosylase domain-containing protein [Tenacibaculum sp. SG-28]PQJ21783.1 lytic transglycosylase [Tenacibaculum sp. SG-28]
MRYFLLLILLPAIVVAQETKQIQEIGKDSLPNTLEVPLVPKDSLFQKVPDSLFTTKDLQLMDSLLIEDRFNSSLFDTIQYVIDDKDLLPIESTILSTALLKERLATLEENTPFHLAFNPALEKVIHSYLKKRRKYFPALMARAKYYFPMFEQYLDQYDIPLEMKYLAIVESALRPDARSYVGATGLWQFMYGTGIQFDLKVSSYVDERRDPVKATIAACKYLSQLYRIFGDWDLALAAYNSGPGNVTKAIKRSGGYRNYWNIRPFLPRETAGYVPAFYATMYLFAYADEHGLYPEPTKIYHFETDTIRVKHTVSFDQITEVTGLDNALLTFLNPAYKLDIIPFVKDKNYAIRIPKVNAIDFLDKEATLYALAKSDAEKREKPLPKYFEMDKRIRYKVRSGDYLGKIAEKFGVRVSDIKRWNRLRSNNLKIGQRLSIYPRKITSSKPVAKSKNTTPKGAYVMYLVKKGDSLWTIAQKYPKVSVDEIKKWNNIWSVKSLKPGMKLKIYKG